MLVTPLRELELELDVFLGPFDLLLSLILRDELDILEVELADVVLAYIDHLEQKGDLDLETTTEFLVLIAALLELKSRLLLPGEEVELEDIEPQEAATELLERMLRYARFRGAGKWIAERHRGRAGFQFRAAPLAKVYRSVALGDEAVPQNPLRLAKAVGALLRTPPKIDTKHIAVARVSLRSRIEHLRTLLRRGRFMFDEAIESDDRMTIAVTLYGLLELYKQGEATWTQETAFGPIVVEGSTF